LLFTRANDIVGEKSSEATVNTLQKIWSHKDLRNRIFLTIGLLAIARILAHIPTPGVNISQLQAFFQQNQIFGLLNVFSGGTMENFSIILMGVGPYITASIIMQLLAVVIPSLEALQKEGEYGQQKITQYTRYLTVPLAFMQGFAMISLLRSQGIVTQFDPITLITILLTTTAGTIFLMWLGEIITENGIGNGVSMIITVGILASLPTHFRNTFALISTGSTLDTNAIFGLVVFLVVFIVSIAFIVLVNEAERRLPIAYARRVRGGSSYGSVQTHLPLKVNTAGVIPIIFALSILLIPGVVARFLATARSPWLANSAHAVDTFLQNQLYYSIFYFILVVGFTYFYTFLVFQPTKIAENLQKQSGFIPGVRPGTETAEYVTTVLSRITLTGSLFLGIIAILPFVIENLTHVQTLAISGTSILIMVSVVLETLRTFQAQLLTRTYDNY
jgi:preprotein translocase subunit SecY